VVWSPVPEIYLGSPDTPPSSRIFWVSAGPRALAKFPFPSHREFFKILLLFVSPPLFPSIETETIRFELCPLFASFHFLERSRHNLAYTFFQLLFFFFALPAVRGSRFFHFEWLFCQSAPPDVVPVPLFLATSPIAFDFPSDPL